MDNPDKPHLPKDMKYPAVECMITLDGHQNSVETVAVHPTKAGIVASGSHDHSLKIWDVNSKKKLVQNILGHQQGVWHCHYNPTGTLIATGSPDSTLRLWDAKNGKSVKVLRNFAKRVYWVKFSPSGNFIVASGSDRKVFLFDTKNLDKPLAEFAQINSIIHTCDFLNGDDYVIAGSFQGDLGVWSVKELKFLYEHNIVTTKMISNIIYSVKALTTGKEGHEFLVGTENKTVDKWEFDNKYLYKSFEMTGHHDSLQKRALSACGDHSLRLWDLETKDALKILAGHQNLVSSCEFMTPDTVVSGSWDQKVKIWKV